MAGVASGQEAKRDEGIDLYRAGSFMEAVTRLTEATAADKTDRQAWVFLAGAYKHLGKEKEAINALKRALAAKKVNLLKYDRPAKITSKYTAGIKGDGSGPSSDYAVAVELCADGTVGVIIPYLTSFIERKQAIIDAAEKIKFDPAVKDGKPVTMIQVIEYSFSFTTYSL